MAKDKSKKTNKTTKQTAERPIIQTDRDDLQDDRLLSQFEDRKERFRNSYGNRSIAYIPEHLKDPKLHYVIVPVSDVRRFLDMGYLVDTKFNGHISEEMVGRANKLGSVPNFGASGGDNCIVMIMLQEWVEHREAEEQAQRDLQFDIHTKGTDVAPDGSKAVVTSGTKTRDIDIN